MICLRLITSSPVLCVSPVQVLLDLVQLQPVELQFPVPGLLDPVQFYPIQFQFIQILSSSILSSWSFPVICVCVCVCVRCIFVLYFWVFFSVLFQCVCEVYASPHVMTQEVKPRTRGLKGAPHRVHWSPSKHWQLGDRLSIILLTVNQMIIAWNAVVFSSQMCL